MLVAAAVLGWMCARSPRVSFLTSRSPASWIVYPAPVSTSTHEGGGFDTVFRRAFDLASLPAAAPLRIRALRRFEVEVNGRHAALASDPSQWRNEQRLDVAPLLRAGANELAVRVYNDNGPPALWLSLETSGAPVRSDATWEASLAGAAWKPAALASDPPAGRGFDPDGIARSLAGSLAAVWPWLLVLLAIAAAVVLGLDLRFGGSRGATLDPGPVLRVAAPTAVALWVVLFINNAGWSCPIGFDVEGHLDYVRHLLDKGSLPLAEQGWQMYHPPLYYALAALVLKAASLPPGEPAGIVALRFLNLVFAAANILLAAASLRLVFPGRPRRQAIGLVLAAALPALLYVFQYPTNEALAITLSTATVYLALRVVRVERARWLDAVLLGACLGAALLAKFSALLLVPVAAAAPLLRRIERREEKAGRLVALALLSLASAAAVSGWHYARVWARYGVPIVGNWDRAAGAPWWQDPGYRTVWDYLRFGPSLGAPLYAGLHGGVWDGLYATLWSDTLCGGVESLMYRPPWSYETMAAGVLLALLPTVGILLGAAALLVRFLRRPEAALGLILLLAFVTGSAVISMTLLVPYYATVKAFYGLVALVPLCALGAAGIDLLAGRARWRRLGVLALLGAWAAVSYATYWIDTGSARARTAAGVTWIAWDHEDRGLAELRAALALDPGDEEARLALAETLLDRGARRDEVEPLLRLDDGARDATRRHVALARLLSIDARLDDALEELDRAAALDPDALDPYLMRGELLRVRGDEAGAIPAWREALRIDPDQPAVHRKLAAAYAKLGRTADALRHEAYAAHRPPPAS
jgi:tetratricopeptide (TPR) repeat protein